MKGPVKNMSLRLTERFHDIRLNIPFLLRLKSTSASKRCRMTMHAQYTFEIVLIVSMLDPLRNAVATTHATSELQLAPCSNTAHGGDKSLACGTFAPASLVLFWMPVRLPC